MILKGLVDEDVGNYRKASMFLIFPYCTFKCDKECGAAICQNSNLAGAPTVEISTEAICERYIKNPITSAVVCGGLEPIDSRFELLGLIDCLRRRYECEDDIVIYTGYTEEELTSEEHPELYSLYDNLRNYSNIIIKYGRYIPNKEAHMDDLLGVKLASPNQYAKRLNERIN